jgi:hypothetical protein
VDQGSYTLNSTQAERLLTAGANDQGLSFAENDTITLNIGLEDRKTVKDLQKLGVDRVVSNIGDVTIGLGGSLGEIDIESLPSFDSGFTASLELDSINDLNAILDSTENKVLNALNAAGIDEIAINKALTDSIDWLDFVNIGDGYRSIGESINFRVDVSGTSFDSEISNFNSSLNAAIRTEQGLGINFATGVDFLANYANPDQFGNLISSLLDSGVTDFVVESGNVEITDVLAAAMVESGMLQALPSANLIINATANLKSITGLDDFARLYTDLKSLSSLDADGIRVHADTNKVFIDLGDLGVPTDDPQALLEIKALLGSLDPANSARSLAQDTEGQYVDVSLVMSTELLNALSGEFNENDFKLFENVGITEIIGLGKNAAESQVYEVVAQNVPPVEIVGSPTIMTVDLFNELNGK